MTIYDVIVIGGGPSGLMAAIAAAEQNATVLLLEKGDKLGRKLAISGGGRCNVTNRLPIDELIKHIPGNGRFLYSAFAEFNNEDIIHFFESLGVELKEEDHGRMFPASNKSQTVISALLAQLNKLNVTVRNNTPVKKVLYENNNSVGVELHDGSIFNSHTVIIAVGGKSVPHTGSTGDGYTWAKEAGHTITELFPTEVPLTSSEPFIKDKSLQGLALRDVAVSVHNPNGKIIVTHHMDMIFTHFGLSGPAILRCSQFVGKALKKYKTENILVTVDSFPDDSEEEIFQRLLKMIKSEPKKAVKNILKGFIPERYLLFLLQKNQIDEKTTISNLKTEKFRSFVKDLKGFEIRVNGTLSFEKAFVTGGGISTKEINPKEMSSKLIKGLYFCGEILDIHGYTGGYNITAALVTGRLAGINAGRRATDAQNPGEV
ncbi:BaiN/RdsA family NAD(P)/FAD-dependent oxidoreductase [Calidifontibacillus oryziterrae]|uniref:NAD(P)/FAD-dependent oxidoreductase n=1 Tax=Calidifontibacillus oryziterrae TaxID=1191699 RepID=UPI0002EBE7C5|nr:NAD(P)/FAD-dependent oxidoreductase [Calidifontibacillus oryziterrae]